MISKSGKEHIALRLREEFGKDIFGEEELTEEFWTELYIRCSDLFKTPEGCVDLDFFWSEDLRRLLLGKK